MFECTGWAGNKPQVNQQKQSDRANLRKVMSGKYIKQMLLVWVGPVMTLKIQALFQGI
jgi:hypothetical protein